MNLFMGRRAIMNKELNSKSDFAEAYLGNYEGSEITLRRISNEVKARRGEYEGFGTYLRQISDEAKARRGIP
jgi:hypothetical protein